MATVSIMAAKKEDSLHRLEVGDGWAKVKQRSLTQETAVHVLCETKDNSELYFTYWHS